MLGQGGAERVTIPGRALARLDGKVIEVQCFWVDKQIIVKEGRDPPPICWTFFAVTLENRFCGAGKGLPRHGYTFSTVTLETWTFSAFVVEFFTL